MKDAHIRYEGGNRLLDAIPDGERADVVNLVEVVHLDSGTVTHAPNVSYDWVVFPIDAVLSVVTTLADGETAEVGTVGSEGASGAEIAFGARRSCERRFARSKAASAGCAPRRSLTLLIGALAWTLSSVRPRKRACSLSSR